MSSALAERAATIAVNQVGKPYRLGAAGPNAFDCSGLMYYAYKGAGKIIPRTTYAMLAPGSGLIKVSRATDLQNGDIVFPEPGHCYMYIGNNQICEAPHTGTTVHITNLYAFWTARRIPGGPNVTTNVPGNIHPGTTTNVPNATAQAPAAGSTPVGGGGGGTVTATNAGFISSAASIGDILTAMTDPHFWLRVAIFIGGLGLLALAIIFLLKGEAANVVTRTIKGK